MGGKKKFHTEHNNPIIRKLEVTREGLGYSQLEMANAIGVPFRTYQKWIYLGQKPRHAHVLLSRAASLIPPRRTNCWDIVRCGREPGGAHVPTEGVCPAATAVEADGVNSGTNGGRICWAISGTFCGRQARGSEAVRLVSCFSCDFFTKVLREEGLASFKLLKPGQSYIQE